MPLSLLCLIFALTVIHFMSALPFLLFFVVLFGSCWRSWTDSPWDQNPLFIQRKSKEKSNETDLHWHPACPRSYCWAPSLSESSSTGHSDVIPQDIGDLWGKAQYRLLRKYLMSWHLMWVVDEDCKKVWNIQISYCPFSHLQTGVDLAQLG